MSVSPVQDPPLVRAVAVIRGVLDRVVDAEASFLTAREKASVLAEVATARAQLASVEAKVLAVGADVADLHATRDVAAWVAHETRQDVRSVRRDARLAHGVEFTHPAIGRALAAGRVGVEQARVIVTGLEKLPTDIDADTVRAAEAYLIEQAGHFPPEQLRVIARRVLDCWVLDVVAPEIAEQALAKQLQDEERDAYAKAKVTSRSNGDGTTPFFWVPSHGCRIWWRLGFNGSWMPTPPRDGIVPTAPSILRTTKTMPTGLPCRSGGVPIHTAWAWHP